MTDQDLLFLSIKYPKLTESIGEFLLTLPDDFLLEFQYLKPDRDLEFTWNYNKEWFEKTVYEELYQYENRARLY